ncbi:MAG: DciA family protein [Lyngbya sp.]|nr:DciA family protein [Lyngbya sp.]
MFQSLNQILDRLQVQLLTPEQQQFQSILDVWATVVSQRAIAQTRPISLTRGVLLVATSSATWSQQLSFERSQMLRRLNQSLSCPLHDIKFSSALWHSQADSLTSDDRLSDQTQQHPSFVPNLPPSSTPVSPATVTPQTAFQNWAEIIQRRAHNLPECPHCHCPTPAGELQRWSVCAMCFSQQRFSP